MLNISSINSNKFGNKSYIIQLDSLFQININKTNIHDQYLIEFVEQKFFNKKIHKSSIIYSDDKSFPDVISTSVSTMVYDFFYANKNYDYSNNQKNLLECEILMFFLKQRTNKIF